MDIILYVVVLGLITTLFVKVIKLFPLLLRVVYSIVFILFGLALIYIFSYWL